MKKIISLVFLFNLYALILNPIAFADQSVSLTIPPRASDFQFTFASDGKTTIPQDKTLSYTITYGAKQSAGTGTTTTIVADFSADTAPDTSNVLDYVIGSASNAYNSTQPVVDLTNRTITWTIANLPEGATDQTVTFQLRTNSNYTGPSSVNFTTRAKMSNQYLTLPDQIITQTYQFQNANPSQNTPPTTTPTPTPTTTITPSPIPSESITGISLTSVSAKQASIQVTTTNPTKLTVAYGTSPNALNETVTTNQYSDVSTLLLNDLKADTIYYFRISATDASGQTIDSEIFEMQTAKQSFSVPSLNGTVVLSSNGNVILSEAINNAVGFALLPDNTAYDLTLSLPDSLAFTAMEAIVQNGSGTPINTVSFVQKQPGVYGAHLTTSDSGTYEILLRSTDANGNVTEQKIVNLKSIAPLSVSDQTSGDPLTNARVYFTYYDTKTNSYHPITQELFGNITNPSYTDINGKINIILPPDRYRADADALFYDSQTVNFTLGPNAGQQFPTISLKKDPLNLFSLFTYTKNLLFDVAISALNAVHAISKSVGLFAISTASVTGSFVVLGFLLFTLKSHMTLKNLPIFFMFSIDLMLKRHKQKYLFGHVTDEENNPLSRVRIEIEDAQTKNIIVHGSTHKLGKFYFNNNFTDAITVIFTKEGYEPLTLTLHSETQIPETGLQIKLEKGTPHHHSVFSAFIAGVEEGWGMLFETFLVLSLILEVLFFILYGFEKVLPFFILSLINISLWLFYLHQQRK